jgi:succinoglycan biosynthesis protein ExoA
MQRMTNISVPDISILLPIRNEEKFIARTLEQVVTQDVGDLAFEIIVIDGESTDRTVSIVEAIRDKYPDVSIRLLNNAKRLSSAARNIGLYAARGRYVLIVDGHVHFPTSHVIRRGVELADEHGMKVIGRPQRLTPPGLSKVQELIAQVRESRVGHSHESHIYSEQVGIVSPISVGVMYDRQLAIEVGGFDENFDAAEDLEFNYRLEERGEDCLISPELEVFYYPRENLRGLFKQMWRYGLGRALFLRKHPKRFTVETIVPTLFVLGIVAGLILGFIWPAFYWTLAIAVFAYCCVVLLATRHVLSWSGTRIALVLSIAFAIHSGLGIGFIDGLRR